MYKLWSKTCALLNWKWSQELLSNPLKSQENFEDIFPIPFSILTKFLTLTKCYSSPIKDAPVVFIYGNTHDGIIAFKG